jgi:5'-deoxynucleotidase YfbR-like HD superfamily hydrolase
MPGSNMDDGMTRDEIADYMREVNVKKNPGMSTYGGSFIDFLNPQVDSIKIEDIAHSLSLICRFNGHCDYFYSVAQHCVHVSYQLPFGMELQGLLHDAPEAYVGDVVGPLKGAMRMLPVELLNHMSQFDIIEERWALAVGAAFELELVDLPAEVKEADARMLVTERRDIFAKCPLWPPRAEDAKPYDFKIAVWEPRQAEETFLQRFHELSHRQSR